VRRLRHFWARGLGRVRTKRARWARRTTLLERWSAHRPPSIAAARSSARWLLSCLTRTGAAKWLQTPLASPHAQPLQPRACGADSRRGSRRAERRSRWHRSLSGRTRACGPRHSPRRGRRPSSKLRASAAASSMPWPAASRTPTAGHLRRPRPALRARRKRSRSDLARGLAGARRAHAQSGGARRCYGTSTRSRCAAWWSVSSRRAWARVARPRVREGSELRRGRTLSTLQPRSGVPRPRRGPGQAARGLAFWALRGSRHRAVEVARSAPSGPRPRHDCHHFLATRY